MLGPDDCASTAASKEAISLSLLFRLLQRMPAVQRLQEERDGLRAERNSMQLKLRAASAEMGVLEEQCRVLQRERDRLTEEVTRRTTEHESQAARLKAALAAGEVLTKERDSLAEERRVLIARGDAASAERDRVAGALDKLRQEAGTRPQEAGPNPSAP